MFADISPGAQLGRFPEIREAAIVSKNVLMLDSRCHITNIAFLCCALSGLKVFACRTIKEAINMLLWTHIDAIVVEAFLENECAFEFIKLLKSSAQYNSIPLTVVAIESGTTGCVCMKEVMATAKILGADNTCIMPKFNGLRLVQKIKERL